MYLYICILFENYSCVIICLLSSYWLNIYIYIYIFRERERERDRDRQKIRETVIMMMMMTYFCFKIDTKMLRKSSNMSIVQHILMLNCPWVIFSFLSFW